MFPHKTRLTTAIPTTPTTTTNKPHYYQLTHMTDQCLPIKVSSLPTQGPPLPTIQDPPLSSQGQPLLLTQDTDDYALPPTEGVLNEKKQRLIYVHNYACITHCYPSRDFTPFLTDFVCFTSDSYQLIITRALCGGLRMWNMVM